jgi:Spy/CpxP family protein refolding chaperone
MKAARDAAHAAGKKGKEANDEIAKAIKLTPEQEAKLEKIRAKRKELDEQVHAALLEILTPQQRELMKKGPGKPKGPPPPKKDAKP